MLVFFRIPEKNKINHEARSFPAYRRQVAATRHNSPARKKSIHQLVPSLPDEQKRNQVAPLAPPSSGGIFEIESVLFDLPISPKPERKGFKRSSTKLTAYNHMQ
jgi:hypothetical protein